MAKKKQNIDSKIYNFSTSHNTASHYAEYVNANSQYFSSNPSSIAKEYYKKPLKLKTLGMWVVRLIVILAIFLAVVTSIAIMPILNIFSPGGGDIGEVIYDYQNIYNYKGLLVAPNDISDLEFDLPAKYSELTDKEFIQFAYEKSLENLKNIDNALIYKQGLLQMALGGSPNYIDIAGNVIKTPTEYFKIDYHLYNNVPILDSFIGSVISKSADVLTGERFYTNSSLNKMHHQKVKNSNRYDNGIPYSTWTNGVTTNTLDVPVYRASQAGLFNITNHTIKPSTILDEGCEVHYNAKDGYYLVKAVLDLSNPETYKYSLADIITGTGDPNTMYSAVSIEFTVWDTGFLRTFFLTEKWDANLVISMSFDFNTYLYFSYDDSDCSIDKCDDAKAYKNTLGL